MIPNVDELISVTLSSDVVCGFFPVLVRAQFFTTLPKKQKTHQRRYCFHFERERELQST